MVTQERKYVSIKEIKQIINESDTKEEMESKLNKLKTRQSKSTPRPNGSISLREASRKYNIPISTLSLWARTNQITIKKRTRNWLYLDESSIKKRLNIN